MAIEVGEKVNGKVSGITNFGAFIDLGDHRTGLVHISEVSDGFVKDIHDVLKVGDDITVKVLKIEGNNKISLSIRKASDTHEHEESRNESHSHRSNHDNEHESHENHGGHENRGYHSRNNGGARNSHSDSHGESFDDMMSGFLKESEDRLSTLRKNTEGKRGGRGGRRS
ncbi:S1 domain-containing RNA-binding protein [uncultured Lentilactobacillus sp.]|uniref:S1 domain-containing RNA-binding protein n=1 Tax=uncultured Lentilactobacillus sp. TaxID=2805375 RepID=UPI002593B7CC|nr:S1 domain-containing RNA-binding protein [uncultured Lentilactobacillus sp.]